MSNPLNYNNTNGAELSLNVNEGFVEGWKVERDQLLKSNSDLRKFAEIITHEINSQLQPAVLSLSIINSKYQQELGEKLHRMSQLGLNSLNGLSAFTREMLELLDYREREAEGYPEVDLSEIAQMAIDQHEAGGNFDSSKVAFHLGSLPKLKGSSTRYLHVFSNLIRNALVHNDTGEEPLTIEIGIVPNDVGKLVIFVKDDGAGIPVQDHEKVFDYQYRGASAKSNSPGSGIGLALCRYAIEQNGGEIWLESEVGRGATFYFTV